MYKNKDILINQKFNSVYNTSGKFRWTRGYTLIEIIVVIAIVAIIAVISVSQFVSQKKGSTIQNTAEQLALNIRKAQSMAMAVRPTGTGVGSYRNGYGIYLNHRSNTGGNQDVDNKSYILFVDFEGTPGAGGWDHSYKKNTVPSTACGIPSSLSNGDECQQKFSFDTDDYISNIEICTTSCSNIGLNDVLAITFLRPNLDAYFCTSSSGCSSISPSGHVNITLTSPIDTTKIVSVWSTGQVGIK